MSISLIHKFNSDPVTPFVDAMMNYMAIGSGIYQNVLEDMEATVRTHTILIKTGYASALGYQFKNTDNTSIAKLDSDIYMVGVLLTVQDEELYAESYAQFKNDYDIAINTAMAQYVNNLEHSYTKEQALAEYTTAVSAALKSFNDSLATLSNNSIIFDTRDTTSTDPVNISGDLLLNGHGSVFVPLWKVTNNTTISVIHKIEPGIPTYAKNLLTDGLINDWPFDNIFNDFSKGNAGVINADHAVKADFSDHIGGTDDSHKIDTNLKMANGYISTTICLFKNKSISFGTSSSAKTTTEITLENQIPSSNFIPLKLIVVGKKGTVLTEVSKTYIPTSSGSSEFPLDADYNDSYISCTLTSTKATISAYMETTGLYKHFDEAEYSELSFYLIGTRVAL